MKPLYNSKSGRVARPRKQARALGQMTRDMQAEAIKYGISKMDIGMTLIGIGVNVLLLNR